MSLIFGRAAPLSAFSLPPGAQRRWLFNAALVGRVDPSNDDVESTSHETHRVTMESDGACKRGHRELRTS